jgi:Uma2 family endonuclease
MPEDGARREIIGGDLLVNPAPRFEHQIVVANIHERLAVYLAEEGNFRVFESPLDVFVSRHDVVQPGLIVIAQRAVARFRREGIVDEPPILVVEVSSPSTSRTDQREKLALYERFGVLEYWIVDPAGHAVSVFSLNPDGKGLELVQTSGHVPSRVFPDLVMLPDEVFRDL